MQTPRRRWKRKSYRAFVKINKKREREIERSN